MKRQRPFHPVALQQRLAPRHLLENFFWEIFSFQKQADMRFVQRRIVEQRQKHIRRGMMQEHGKLIARSVERASAIIGFGVRHASALVEDQGTS